jgi:hypothetical protein
MHEREDGAFVILDGHFAFRVGAQTLTVGPGEYVVAARGIPHAFRNLGTAPARKLALAWPAGLDQFFLAVGQPVDETLVSPTPPPDADAASRFVAAVATYGTTMLEPSTWTRFTHESAAADLSVRCLR